jgi:hypothetical protein
MVGKDAIILRLQVAACAKIKPGLHASLHHPKAFRTFTSDCEWIVFAGKSGSNELVESSSFFTPTEIA